MEVKAAVLLLLVFLQGCATQYFHDAGPPPQPAALTLESWPHRDLWTGVVFEGESAAELVPPVNLVGRVRVASVSALARW